MMFIGFRSVGIIMNMALYQDSVSPHPTSYGDAFLLIIQYLEVMNAGDHAKALTSSLGPKGFDFTSI